MLSALQTANLLACRLYDSLGIIVVISSIILLGGCSSNAQAPSIPVFGSYFPAWIICAAFGVMLAIVLRVLLVKTDVNSHLPLPPLVYLCAAILGGTVSWLIWTGAI